jgi:hypothetical protein
LGLRWIVDEFHGDILEEIPQSFGDRFHGMDH